MPKTKGLVFPYGIRLKEGGVIEIFPAIEIFFLSKDGEKLSLFLIIDSGATVSVLPKSDAEVFGVQAENGNPLLVSGINGETIKGWKHKIAVYFGDRKIQLPLVFIDNKSAPRVLGREGIFNCFTIVFEEEKRRTGFLEKQSLWAQNIQKILDDFQSY